MVKSALFIIVVRIKTYSVVNDRTYNMTSDEIKWKCQKSSEYFVTRVSQVTNTFFLYRDISVKYNLIMFIFRIMTIVNKFYSK